MKTEISPLLGAVLALLVVTITINGATSPCATTPATRVYDLKTDWSDTQNPHGTWSYRNPDGSLLPPNQPTWCTVLLLPAWGEYCHDDDYSSRAALMKTTEATVMPGHREPGDIIAIPGGSGVMARWTAPARGTINISGAVWDALGPDSAGSTLWRLTHNGVALSEGTWGGGDKEYPRSSPFDFSLGSGGANALLAVPVEAGDQIELAFIGFPYWGPVGVNLTITLTTDSVDPVAAIEDLAMTVVEMNLQNGIESSLDSKLDAALNALVDANFNNDGAACNSLAAFISAVEAQRGNKITSAQADQLITSAQEIQCLLNCGD